MTLPAAKTRNVDGRRRYVINIDGTEFLAPSASAVVGVLDKPAIAGWNLNRHLLKCHELLVELRSIRSPETFKRTVRAAVAADGSPAAESGDRVHESIEAYLLGEPLPDYDETPWAVKHAADIVAEFDLRPLQVSPERTGVELTVCRIEDGYPLWAGTSDLIGEWTLDGVRHRGCVDWKSGASGLWPDGILTTSVYTGATHWLAEDGIPVPFDQPLDQGALVWVRPEGYSWVPISAEQTAHAVEVVRSLVLVASWKDGAKLADPANANPIRKAARR